MFLGLRLPVTDAILEIPDKVLKTAAMFFGQDLLPYLGVKGRITGIVPTEQVHLELRRMEEDFKILWEIENTRALFTVMFIGGYLLSLPGKVLFSFSS